MSEGITGFVDLNPLMTATRKISEDTGKEIGAIMHDVAALTCADLIKSTPPVELSDGRRGSDAAAFRLGKAAVARDIGEITYGVPNWGKWYVGKAKGMPAATTMFKGDSRAVFITGDDLVDKDGGKLAGFHASKRNWAGVVSKSTRRQASTPLRDGRYMRKYQMVTTARKKKEYIKQVQAHVGKTRAGWLAGWNYFKKFALTTTYQAPEWVNRHGESQGTYTDAGDYNSFQVDLTITNRVPWIRKTIVARMVDSVLRTREKDFARGFYLLRLQRVLDKQRAAGAVST